MCQYDFGIKHLLPESMKVWKVVRFVPNDSVPGEKRYFSPVSIEGRQPQREAYDGEGDVGTTLEYTLGKKSVSRFDDTEGIYVYLEERWAKGMAFGHQRVVLECEVPEGSLVILEVPSYWVTESRKARVEELIPIKETLTL